MARSRRSPQPLSIQRREVHGQEMRAAVPGMVHAPHLAAFYLAIGRSASCSPPLLRGLLRNCDQTRLDPARPKRSRGSIVAVVVRRPRWPRVRRAPPDRSMSWRGSGGCRDGFFADRVQEDDKQSTQRFHSGSHRPADGTYIIAVFPLVILAPSVRGRRRPRPASDRRPL